MVACTCSLSYLGGWIAWTREVELQWADFMPLHSSLATEWDSVSKKKKKSSFIIKFKLSSKASEGDG